MKLKRIRWEKKTIGIRNGYEANVGPFRLVVTHHDYRHKDQWNWRGTGPGFDSDRGSKHCATAAIAKAASVKWLQGICEACVEITEGSDD